MKIKFSTTQNAFIFGLGVGDLRYGDKYVFDIILGFLVIRISWKK